MNIAIISSTSKVELAVKGTLLATIKQSLPTEQVRIATGRIDFLGTLTGLPEIRFDLVIFLDVRLELIRRALTDTVFPEPRPYLVRTGNTIATELVDESVVSLARFNPKRFLLAKASSIQNTGG